MMRAGRSDHASSRAHRSGELSYLKARWLFVGCSGGVDPDARGVHAQLRGQRVVTELGWATGSAGVVALSPLPSWFQRQRCWRGDGGGRCE
jgi:hypothetical protein